MEYDNLIQFMEVECRLYYSNVYTTSVLMCMLEVWVFSELCILVVLKCVSLFTLCGW